MKIAFLVCLLGATTQTLLAQEKQKYTPDYPHFDHALLLEGKSDTTANVSFGDLDGDGHLDILLVKGRHWPITDLVLLGDGKGNVRKKYNLGTVSDRSYTGAVADFNGDSFPDIAISNDYPDAKLVYFNDGRGSFTLASEFGLPQWLTRNISIADINRDGMPDIILANRGETSNRICLNWIIRSPLCHLFRPCCATHFGDIVPVA